MAKKEKRSSFKQEENAEQKRKIFNIDKDLDGFTILIIVLLIYLFVAGIAMESTILILLSVLLFFVTIVVWAYLRDMLNKKKAKKALEDAQEKWKKQGLSMTKVYGTDLLFVLFVDYDKCKFAIDYSGKVYDISKIRGFNVYNYGFSIWLSRDLLNIEEYKPKPYPDIDIGITVAAGRGNYSDSVDKFTKHMVDLIGTNKNEFYAKHRFFPTEEFWYRGQMFSYDFSSRQFCLFTFLGFEIFNFSDFIDLDIRKNSDKVNSFGWGGALTGMLIGGNTGAAYWAKDSKKMCEFLELSVICADETIGSTTTDYSLIKNCKIDESSAEFKQIECFISNIKRACKTIKSKKR